MEATTDPEHPDVYLNSLYDILGHVPNSGNIEDAIGFLYAQLALRPREVNISHRRMPTYTEHDKFVRSKPYAHWWLIRAGLTTEWVGHIYLSKQNEVGVFIDPRYQGKGIAAKALTLVEEKFPTIDLLANVAPDNKVSQEMFQARGYKLIQHTYRLTRDK